VQVETARWAVSSCCETFDRTGQLAGLCPGLDGFAAQWRLDRRFQPRMGKAERERKYSGWQDAVRRTLTAR